MSLAWFLDVLYRVIHLVIQTRAWPHMFARLGLAEDQSVVARHILDHVEADAIPQVAPGPPTDEDLRLMCAEGRAISADVFLPPPPDALLPAAAVGAGPAGGGGA